MESNRLAFQVNIPRLLLAPIIGAKG